MDDGTTACLAGLCLMFVIWVLSKYWQVQERARLREKDESDEGDVHILDESLVSSRIDLHGLSVREALKKLEEKLEEAKRSGYQFLDVITGRGNNSGLGGPKIKPAVLYYLDNRNFKYDIRSKGGRITVQLVTQ